MTSRSTYCSGCGHDTVGSEEPVYEVRDGQFNETAAGNQSWKPGRDVWGYIHRSCFLMAIGDPDGVVASGPVQQASV